MGLVMRRRRIANGPSTHHLSMNSLPVFWILLHREANRTEGLPTVRHPHHSPNPLPPHSSTPQTSTTSSNPSTTPLPAPPQPPQTPLPPHNQKQPSHSNSTPPSAALSLLDRREDSEVDLVDSKPTTSARLFACWRCGAPRIVLRRIL